MSYKKEMKYILELLKCAITDSMPSLPPDNTDWEQIYHLAVHHKIVSTLYFGMQKLPKQVQSTIKYFDRYLLRYKEILVQDANRQYEVEQLKKEFEKYGIDYVLLKGSVSKYLYPDTSMRVMSDVDILYRNANLNLIHNIFMSHKYQLYKKEPKEVSYLKPNLNIKFEMQTRLVDEGYELWSHYLSDIWDKLIPSENMHEYHMKKEDFYIYHIIHMAKHFKHGGIGLIHLMDVHIINQACTGMNQDYLEHEFALLGLKTFEYNMRHLAAVWFGSETISNKDFKRTLDLLEQYIFYSGAFGQKSQQEINAIVARNDTKISWRKKIFPDQKTMVDYYGSTLESHKWLLPFYWIRLNCKRLFMGPKKLKENFDNLSSISEERIDFTKELMDRCGLSDMK